MSLTSDGVSPLIDPPPSALGAACSGSVLGVLASAVVSLHRG